MSVIVPKRIDKCANDKPAGGTCTQWAKAGEFYCGDACRSEAAERVRHKIGGSIVRHMEEYDVMTNGEDQQIGATRRPQIYYYKPKRVD